MEDFEVVVGENVKELLVKIADKVATELRKEVEQLWEETIDNDKQMGEMTLKMVYEADLRTAVQSWQKLRINELERSRGEVYGDGEAVWDVHLRRK